MQHDGPPCALCGSLRTSLLTGNGVRDVHTCRSCHVRFTWPQPTAAEGERFYATEYIPDESSRQWNFIEQRGAALHRACEAVVAAKSGGRILDVGSAGGAFLDLFDKACWTRSAVEPAEVANRAATTGIATFEGLYPDAVPTAERFDVITMLDLVMLLPDPVTALEAAHGHLAPDGLLAVEIPGNAFRMLCHVGPVPRLRGRGRTDLMLDMHLYLFDDRSLRWLLDRTGFEPTAVVPLPASRVRQRAVDLGLRAWSRATEVIPGVRSGRPSIGPKYLYLARRS